MIYQVPFGDYYQDGHRHYGTIWVNSPDINDIAMAQEEIRAQYGEDFFTTFLNEYDEYTLKPIHWEALYEADFEMEDFEYLEKRGAIDWDGERPNFDSLTYFMSEDAIQPFIYPEACIKMFFTLIREHRSNIEVLACPPFPLARIEHVGYGSYSCYD